jgi:hypothetical protein
MRTLTQNEIELLKRTLHGALDGRNGTVCSDAQPERFAALSKLVADGYMEGGHSCAMTGPGIRYFYVSEKGREAVES